MFNQLMKRSNAVWIYNTGRFAEERRTFVCDLMERGYGWYTLRQTNKFLLDIAERVNVRQRTPITERQIVRAARDWASKTCSPSCTDESRDQVTKRFIFVAKKWFRFLGKWPETTRNPQFKPELDSFLKELRDERGYTDQTVTSREEALNLFFEWLGKQGVSLKEVTPEILAAYFVQNKARGWKKSTVKAYGNSLRVFFRYATRRGWCAQGLAETIESPRIYSNTGLPEGPSWEQVQRLIASLDTERVNDIRDRAVILLLAVYGLRIGEVCRLTLDDFDWTNEKLRIRRLKNKRIQEFPLTAETGNAILKYLRKVRPQTSLRFLFLTLRKPHRPMRGTSASSTIARRVHGLGHLPHYGPHSLRHACASHLLDEGFSIKEIGDHLGHRSLRSTQIYAKVEHKKLAQVATGKLSRLTEYFRAQTQPITADWAKERLRSLREVSNFGLGGLQ
ncbi:MAG TPA: site-specific integrase [Terriglobia bacterium]|nr:site-specific integrase [Terriglobia bacterium]